MLKSVSGKVKLSLVVFGALLFLLVITLWDSGDLSFQRGATTVKADTATTTLQVLNIAPNWTVDPAESPSSATTTPVNVGASISFTGTATDPNGDAYYLLICKTSSTPTAGSGGATPSCAGGAGNLWAVSATTTSASPATATHVTTSTDGQIDAWFGWICDNNSVSAQCNATVKQGSGDSGSPFYVNHWPTFASISNTSPTLPGATTTWNAVASDSDSFSGTQVITLFICKASDFTGTACGAGGTYCTATSTSNPSCGYNIPIPRQDQSYNAYPFIIDQYNLAASSSAAEGTNNPYTVAVATPTISSSTVTLNNNNTSTVNLTLTSSSGQTNSFTVKFTVADNNSCLNASSGNEIASVLANVYRSGVTQASCQTSGNYNADNCYPFAVGTSTWNINCVQDGGSCVGSSSLTATFTCTFPLWYVSDPTDGTAASDTQYFSQVWTTSVKATSWAGPTSTLVEAAAGTELSSFLSYHLNSTAISYGALQPGQTTDPLVATTSLLATGNVGLDETLYGLDMCTTFPGCPVSTTSTVPIGQQHYASSGVAYASGFTALVNPGALFRLGVPKSTATSTNASGSTFWGISVPGTIQQAGNYTGQNTLIGVKSSALTW
jgi:hypothetical protein